MILDNECTFAVARAFGTAAGDEIDLESISGDVGPGPGNPIKCFVQGSGLTGATGFVVESGPTTGTVTGAKITHEDANVVNDLIEFELPSDIGRFVTLTMSGTLSAGTWSAAIILPGAQTAK